MQMKTLDDDALLTFPTLFYSPRLLKGIELSRLQVHASCLYLPSEEVTIGIRRWADGPPPSPIAWGRKEC